MTDRYPLIKSVLGLGIYENAEWTDGDVGRTFSVVSADDLERALEKGVRVYSQKYAENNKFGSWSVNVDSPDTHTALLIGITPIEREREAVVHRTQLIDELRAEVERLKSDKILCRDIQDLSEYLTIEREISAMFKETLIVCVKTGLKATMTGEIVLERQAFREIAATVDEALKREAEMRGEK